MRKNVPQKQKKRQKNVKTDRHGSFGGQTEKPLIYKLFYDFQDCVNMQVSGIIEAGELHREFPRYGGRGRRMTDAVNGGTGFRDGGFIAGPGGRKGWG